MVIHAEPQARAPQAKEPRAGRRATYRVTGWVVAGLGAIAAFVSAVILVGPDDQYVGLGGTSTSWQIGQIAPAWGYGLLTVGVLAVVAGITLVRLARRSPTATAEPETGWADFAAHATVFAIVNAFLWLQDIALGDGLDYAIWVTVPWAIGLTAHGIACYANQREERARGPRG